MTTTGTHVPRVRYQVAASLDGFIAPHPGALGPGRADHDWIPMDPEIDFGALFRQFDTLLMGRKTFAGLAAQGQGGSTGAFGMRTCVVSRTLAPSDHPGLRIVNDDLAGAVADLKRAARKDIWLFGGGELCASLLALGLVDRVEVALLPVLLGDGVALSGRIAGEHRLRLANQRTYASSGTVLLEYDVVR
jgi:dihydrofolate reductase